MYRYVGNNPMTNTDPTGMCRSTFNGMVAAATSYIFNPLGAIGSNTSFSSYSSSGSTGSGSYSNQSFTANVGGFMPMTFGSSQQYNSDYALTSSSYSAAILVRNNRPMQHVRPLWLRVIPKAIAVGLENCGVA